MRDRPLGYRAYLLRFWPGRSDLPGSAAWRFSLEDPHTGERRGFVGLDALVAHLQAEISVASGPARDLPPPAPSEADEAVPASKRAGHHDR